MKLKSHISLNSFILSTIILFGCTGVDVVPFKTSNVSVVLIKNTDGTKVNEKNLSLDDKIILEDLSITKRNGEKEDITPTWTSSDTTIATIEQVPSPAPNNARAGEKWAVVGKKPGTVEITGAYSFDNAGETKKGVVEKSFTFKFANQPMLTIGNPLVSLHKGDTHPLNVKYWNDKGQTVDNPSVTWSSSDATKLSINPTTGLLTAIAITTTEITITASFSNADRGINISNSLTINVTEAPTVRKAMLMINSHANTIEANKTLNLTFAYTKSSGEVDTTITPTWSSSDITKASISATGLVTAKSVGEITITIRFTPTGEEEVTSTSTLNIIAAPVEKKRTGTFPAGAPYNIGGTVELVENTDGSFKLVFQANFNKVGGPDPWIYLNRTAYTSGVPDLEILNLKTISKLNDDTAEIYEYPLPTSLKISTINEYNHLVIFCKAFGYKFSTAELSK